MTIQKWCMTKLALYAVLDLACCVLSTLGTVQRIGQEGFRTWSFLPAATALFAFGEALRAIRLYRAVRQNPAVLQEETDARYNPPEFWLGNLHRFIFPAFVLVFLIWQTSLRLKGVSMDHFSNAITLLALRIVLPYGDKLLSQMKK